jgi:hypothetical protein
VAGVYVSVWTKRLVAISFAGVLILGGCTRHESEEQRHNDANTPAGKVGQTAHKMAVEADKAAHEAKRKLDKAAHDARAGWNEDAQKNKGNNQ